MILVINETLRYYPADTHVDRVALGETILSNGLKIPKGGVVRIPIYHIHHREEYFPHHQDFNPERFLPENKDSLNKNAFIPFFTGPRNCLGMRFAYLETKWTMTNVILQYKFSRPVDDKDDFRKVPANATLICPDVYVVVEKLAKMLRSTKSGPASPKRDGQIEN
jgi:cytochrome P450